PLMMSPVRNAGRVGWPVSASRKCTEWSYAPKMTSVTPSGRSQTTGWPVQPVPHHVVVSPPTVDWPHSPPDSGTLHRFSGSSGTGPTPYQVRVGLPRNIVRPSTSPQGLPTIQSGTTSAGRSGSVVVVVDDVEVVGSSVVAVGSWRLVDGSVPELPGAAEASSSSGTTPSVRNRAAPTRTAPRTRTVTTVRRRADGSGACRPSRRCFTGP